ncbi:MAG: type II secretion system protein GspE, partial [Proteobacteria bacterium]|nr:type II secretion system protein GspE [Pseudomonadota bacterium]
MTLRSQLHSVIRLTCNVSTTSALFYMDQPEAEDFEYDLEEPVDLLEASENDAPIIKFVNNLMFRAIKDKASDIHIEPYEKDMVVRLRIDGVLYDVARPPKGLHAGISSRIKLMGELDIAEKRLPQDGRIKIKIAGKDVDLRLSVIPTAHGERLVLRVLDKSSVRLDLPDLGFDPESIKVINQLIHKQHGIILVTGPTGSGKTTTLYAAISRINSIDRNIITVEDPIEYDLKGIGQIQANPKIGLTFASGLRAILRQDPDVIMVGEIRDKETAEIAIQASLTGHLVFATIHTNDAPGAV